MILTDKSDAFQKLLKDVEDIKIKLRESRYFVGVNPIRENKPLILEEGVWVVILSDGSLCRTTNRYDATNIWGFVRLATEEEIEKHLVAEAKKRGFKRGTILVDLNGCVCDICDPSFYYEKSIDCLWCSISVNGYYSATGIYRDGKWADIIPPKKPIPKTKKELAEFLGGYICDGKKAAEFLSEYED